MKMRLTFPAAAALALAAAALLAACNPQDDSAPAADAVRQNTPAAADNAGRATPAAQATPATAHSDGVRRVTIAESRAMAESGEAVIYDVRDQKAYETSHVKGAKLVPLGEVAARAAEFPKDKLIITYCA